MPLISVTGMISILPVAISVILPVKEQTVYIIPLDISVQIYM